MDVDESRSSSVVGDGASRSLDPAVPKLHVADVEFRRTTDREEPLRIEFTHGGIDDTAIAID
jgi:hypothetical protein